MKRKILFAVACLASLTVFAGITTFAEKKAKPKELSVKELMQKAHKGKDSPLVVVKTQVKLDQPDWALVLKNTKPLSELAGKIKDNRTYTSHPGPYVKAVKQLAAAAKEKNHAKAKLAITGLNKSCAGCHR